MVKCSFFLSVILPSFSGKLPLSRLRIQLKNSTSDAPIDCIIRYPATAAADSYTDIYCDLLSATKLILITGEVSGLTAISEEQVFGPRKLKYTNTNQCS